MKIAYHASHEQFRPSHLLQLVKLAEASGFDAIHSSDHFHPWSKRQGQSGFSFAWIAAAMQITRLPYSMVCAPGQRYHPAIAAQAIATLAEMYPGRIDVELGSGEALNESITGLPWPSHQVRNERLLECAGMIRKLLIGQEVSFEGHIRIREARLYTLPETAPRLLCAAISTETSAWAGSWADGLLTTAGSKDDTLEKKNAFEKSGGAGKPFWVQLSFSYHPDYQVALDGAWEQWRSNLLGKDELAELYKPEQFDEATEKMTKEEVADKMHILTSMDHLDALLDLYRGCGVDRISLHNVNTHQDLFIRDFGRRNK